MLDACITYLRARLGQYNSDEKGQWNAPVNLLITVIIVIILIVVLFKVLDRL